MADDSDQNNETEEFPQDDGDNPLENAGSALGAVGGGLAGEAAGAYICGGAPVCVAAGAALGSQLGGAIGGAVGKSMYKPKSKTKKGNKGKGKYKKDNVQSDEEYDTDEDD